MAHRITVISKHGCLICEEAIRVLESLRKTAIFELEVLYIEDDQSLHDSYWLKIPVVRIDSKDIYEAEELALPGDCRKKLEFLIGSFDQRGT